MYTSSSRRIRIAGTLTVILCATLPAAADTAPPLLDYLPGIAAPAPPGEPGAIGPRWPVRVDTTALDLPFSLSLTLPDGRVLEVRARHRERHLAGGVDWYFELGGDGSGGWGVLSSYAGQVAGQLVLGEESWALEPAGGAEQTAVITALQSSGLPACGGALPVAAEDTLQPSPEFPLGGGPTPRRIDVLVVYTPAVRTAVGGAAAARALAQNAVAWSNHAFGLSGALQRVSLADAREIAYVEQGVPAGTQLTWLRDNATVASWRNAVGADLVAMISNDGGGACGIGYYMGNVGPGFAPHGYSMSARTCAVGNLSFPHELGHNMGAHHDPANAPGSGELSYPYAYGHLVNGSFRTVMAYDTACPGGCPRQPVFSTPFVTYDGHPTGIANQRHNARVLDNTMAVVAAFRPRKPTFTDVPSSHGRFSAIEAVASAGVTGGCSSSPARFCPQGTITRAQLAPTLLRAARGSGYQPPAATGMFQDVPVSHPFAAWIEELARSGVTGGCSTSPPRFCPGRTVPRQQLAVFLLRARLGSSYTPPPATGMFQDVPVGSPYAPWIEDLVQRGHASGCSTSPPRFCPGKKIGRAPMAWFLTSVFALPVP